jgi:hypothetical protein
MADFVADFLVSIVPTYIVSRLLPWCSKQWTDALLRLVLDHALSLALCTGVGAIVMAGDHLEPLEASLALFAPGQLAWPLIDVFRLVIRQRRAGRMGSDRERREPRSAVNGWG